MSTQVHQARSHAYVAVPGVVMAPVTRCEGCGRPLYVPHVDVPGIRCHWCSENVILYREPAPTW